MLSMSFPKATYIYRHIMIDMMCDSPHHHAHVDRKQYMHVLKIRYMTPVIHVTYRPNKFA